MPDILHIHHIAVIVDDIDESLAFWRDVLGIAPSHIDDVTSESARIAFLPIGTSQVELVQPTTPDSGLSRFLEKHGPGMHHLCLEVSDLKQMLIQLKAKGIQLINDEPKTGEDGRLYAFIHPKSTQGVLVELYQVP